MTTNNPDGWKRRLTKTVDAFGEGNERAADVAARLIWRGMGGTNAARQIEGGERLVGVTTDHEQPLLSRVIAVWCARPQHTEAARELLSYDIRIGEPDDEERLLWTAERTIMLAPPYAYVSVPAELIALCATVIGMTVYATQHSGNMLLRWDIKQLVGGTFER